MGPLEWAAEPNLGPPDRPRRSLIYPGFGPGTLLLGLGMVVSVVLFGFTMPYYNKAASDMVSVYEALLFNSGLTQDFLVYPALVDRVLLGWWFELLHTTGLIPISRLEEFSALDDVKAYDAQWQTLVEAGRVFSLLMGVGCTVSIVALVYRWLGVWQIAVLAGTAFAFSSGVALGFRILRPEMLAATLTFSALLVMIISAKQDRTIWRLLGLAGAGWLVSFAILDKVQSIIPALALLPLAIAFGARPPAAGPKDERATWVWAAALALLALTALWPAALILGQGIAAMTGTPINGGVYRAVGLSGRYQFATAALIVAAMIGYAAIWRVSVAETVAGIAAIGLGVAAGFDLLYLQSSLGAVVAVANPIEHLQALSAGDGAQLLTQSPLAMLATILGAVGRSLAIHSFFLSPMHRPTLLLEWLSWGGLIVALRNGRTLMAVQIFLLLSCAIVQDAIFSLRQVKVYYLPYSDLPIVLAGALALSQFKNRLMDPWSERATLAMMIVYIVWGHAQPALAVYSQHDKGKVCGIVVQFTKRMTIPYCASKSKPAATGFDDS